MELTGTITKIGDIQTFASGFQKREIVLTTQEQYPQPIAIEFVQDKIDLADAHKEGDSVTIGINLRGRKWTSPQGEDKYFNSIVGWKIIADKGTEAPTPAPEKTPAPTPAPVTETTELFEEDDDLPF